MYAIRSYYGLELISWSNQGERLIIEDDYDSELRYVGKPISSVITSYSIHYTKLYEISSKRHTNVLKSRLIGIPLIFQVDTICCGDA